MKRQVEHGLRGFVSTFFVFVTVGQAQSTPDRKPSVPVNRDLGSRATAALAFTGVTVIDVTDGRRLREQTVIVAGSRVQAVGAAGQVRMPSKARVVDARGKYLIPGLWDMHAHVNRNVQLYPLYIANGVTGIREMAQRGLGIRGQPLVLADTFRLWQRQVAAGLRVGPRSVGPSVDLTNGDDISIRTADDVKRIIDSLKAAGTAFFKYHDSWGTPELFFAMAREARRVGLPIVGHVPRNVTNVQVADSGLRSLEHMNAHHQCWPDGSETLGDSTVAEARCAPVAQAYIRNGTWATPTLVVDWRSSRLASGQQVVRILHRLGARRFLAGTDAPVVRGLPAGFSLLEEVIYLAGAGLTPLEALQAATLNPAQFFEATDSLGTVTPGKLADLVLLDADPLTDVRNLMRIHAVVANGHYFNRAALDTMDPNGARLAKNYPMRYGYINYIQATRVRRRVTDTGYFFFDAPGAEKVTESFAVQKKHDKQLDALLDSLGPSPDTLTGYRRLAQLLGRQIGEYRSMVASEQHAVFDRGARAWLQQRAAEGYSVKIDSIAE